MTMVRLSDKAILNVLRELEKHGGDRAAMCAATGYSRTTVDNYLMTGRKRGLVGEGGFPSPAINYVEMARAVMASPYGVRKQR